MAQKPKPKAKTEEKAKGLIGLEKGKKVEGAAYSVGNYKGKTLNLSKKELGKAGQKAAAARTVKIQDTKYEGKKVLGPGGKPLTGSVDLGGGNIAVYKNGVRVRAQKPKPAPVPGSGGATSPGGGGGGGYRGQTMAQAGASAGRRQAAMAADRKATSGGSKRPPSTSMGRPGQKPPGAKAYAAARSRAAQPDSRGLPSKGTPGQVITKNGKKYRWTSTQNLWQGGRDIKKTEGWVEFK